MLGDSPEPGAPPDEAGALSPEHRHKLLLAEVLLYLIVVIAEGKVDVSVHAAELDRSLVIGPCSSLCCVKSTRVLYKVWTPLSSIPKSLCWYVFGEATGCPTAARRQLPGRTCFVDAG